MEKRKEYKILQNNLYRIGAYSLLPIRYEDRMLIMKWRNEQIYHLRQIEPLTEPQQDQYFNDVVARLFEEDKPGQLLFSYLEKKVCIGYGGLVHINWLDKNAEISFIMKTELEIKHFQHHWRTFLELIEEVAFDELGLHKIYTYAFDLRPHLYKALEASGYQEEAVLKDHCFFQDEFIDVVIHCKFNPYLTIRPIGLEDKQTVYEWAIDPMTRANSFNSDPISYDDHSTWFDNKIASETKNFICDVKQEPAALVRFDEDNGVYTIGIMVAPQFRGKGLGSAFVKLGCRKLRANDSRPIVAYIRSSNNASIRIFEKAGFKYVEDAKINGIGAVKYSL